MPPPGLLLLLLVQRQPLLLLLLLIQRRSCTARCCSTATISATNPMIAAVAAGGSNSGGCGCLGWWAKQQLVQQGKSLQGCDVSEVGSRTTEPGTLCVRAASRARLRIAREIWNVRFTTAGHLIKRVLHQCMQQQSQHTRLPCSLPTMRSKAAIVGIKPRTQHRHHEHR